MIYEISLASIFLKEKESLPSFTHVYTFLHHVARYISYEKVCMVPILPPA